MGNKTNTAKPPSKHQATQALPSGIGYNSDVGAAPRISVIRIPLIQLNLQQLSKISIGDPVSVRWSDTGFYCFYKRVRLGKIPANYANKFVQSHSYKGFVFSFGEEPPAVTIEIAL